MATVTVKVLEPPDSIDFLSLAEAKQMLSLTSADPTADALLQLEITTVSATMAKLCNRVFGRRRLIETWRNLADTKIFLTQWPVNEDDLEDVEGLAQYELEEETGILRGLGALSDPVRITYSGGYELPDDAPPDLKQATRLLLGQTRGQAARESVEGIRMIAHKESRVIFFDPNQAQAKATTASGSSGLASVDVLLGRYTRYQA